MALPVGFHQRWLRRLWLGYWVIMFALTHWPKPKWPRWAYQPSDKGMHLVAYFLLGVIGWLALSARPGRRPWRPVEWFAVLVVYGAFDEVSQSLVRRYCSSLDLLADAVGAAAAIAFVELCRRFTRPAPAG